MFDPPGTTPIAFALTPGSAPLGTALAPNGLVYVSGVPEFGVYDPATNLYTPIGNWPPSIIGVRDMFFYNGQLYGISGTNLILIDINNPANSTIASAGTLPDLGGNGAGPTAACFVPGFGAVMANSGFMDLYDMTTNTYTSLCFIPVAITGLATPLNTVPEFACSCTTDAGTMQGSLLNACVNTTLTAVHDGNQVLDANDLLRYILFSNPSDTVGSIVATSATPSFTFAPPMQTGVTYYLAAVAGDNLNGNVDLADPCLDFSNALQVVWQPLPAVTFSVTNPNVCAGACTMVTANFTGTAPFTLTYTTPASGTVTQTFSGNAGTFQVCTLPGSPPGSLVVQATKVMDAWCTCE